MNSKKLKGDAMGWGIIHEEYAKSVNEKRCFRRHEITPEHWQKMTSDSELRFWKASGIQRNYTAFGYGVIRHCRRWVDGTKVIDLFVVTKSGTPYEEIHRKIEEVL